MPSHGYNKCPPGQYLLFISTSILSPPPQINAESNKAVQSWRCHQVTKMEMEMNHTWPHFSLCASQRIMQILEAPSPKCTNTHTPLPSSTSFPKILLGLSNISPGLNPNILGWQIPHTCSFCFNFLLLMVNILLSSSHPELTISCTSPFKRQHSYQSYPFCLKNAFMPTLYNSLDTLNQLLVTLQNSTQTYLLSSKMFSDSPRQLISC